MRTKSLGALLVVSLVSSIAGGIAARSQEGTKTSPEEASASVIVTPDSVRWVDSPSLPPGAKVAVLEGDPRAAGPFTMRFQFPADYRIPPHSHPGDERATVISGTLYLGTGEKVDRSRGKALPAGSFAITRARQPHFAWTREATVVQVHGIGPWGVTYVDQGAAPKEKSAPSRTWDSRWRPGEAARYHGIITGCALFAQSAAGGDERHGDDGRGYLQTGNCSSARHSGGSP